MVVSDLTSRWKCLNKQISTLKTRNVTALTLLTGRLVLVCLGQRIRLSGHLTHYQKLKTL